MHSFNVAVSGETVQPGYISFCVRFLVVDDVLEDVGKVALSGSDFCGGHL